jgi:ERCC4-type nuclease
LPLFGISVSQLMVTEAIEKVQIAVDDRERSSGIVAELEKLDAVIVKMEHLAVGHYCIDGRC